MFRKDRAKGGGGPLIYISTTIPWRKLTLPTTYKTLEAIAADVKIGRQDILILSIYRPLNSSEKENNTYGNYLRRVESELNNISQWACFKKKTSIIIGDFNPDRLRLDRSEWKILRDLEEVNDLHCLINEPTRVTENSQTLIDEMLTNNLDLVKNCDVFNPEISDHSKIYGEITVKVKKHTTKTLVHWQTKTTDFDNLNKIYLMLRGMSVKSLMMWMRLMTTVLQMNMLPWERNGFVKEMYVSCLKNGKRLLETRGNMSSNSP